MRVDPQQAKGVVTFKTTTNLVIVNVNVRDKSGKPMVGLKASDFALTEDDKPQKVSVFEFQQLASEKLPVIPPPPEPKKGEKSEKRAPVLQNEITPSGNGEIRFRDRRLVVLFFDFSSMQPEDQFRAQKAAERFVTQQMTAADTVSIMALAQGLRVVQDFTDDREKLLDVIGSFRIGESSELAVEGSEGDEESGEDTGAAFTADDAEFNIFNTDRKLGALEAAVKMLRSLPEKKALIYFSSGVGKTGVENQSQLRATINAAVRSNVSFYTVDARGLQASAPAGDATHASQRGTSVYSGAAQRSMKERFNNQQETLFTLANDTGGRALLDNNDLSMGIVQAQKDISSYYILGYYSTNPSLDGRFRRIKVRLNFDLSAKLDYRSGYFASKEFKKFTGADKEQQLQEAIGLGDPITDLSLALEVNYFRLAHDRYFVPVAVKIPGSEVELISKRGNQRAEFDFIGQVRDSKNKLMGVVRDAITVKLGGDAAGQIARRQLQYDTAFTLPPGDYSIRFLIRENTTGKMGTFATKFKVPDLTVAPAAAPASLSLSSVVWAHQRAPLEAAVGAAEKDRKLLASHPLIHDGQKLIPSITRVFRKNHSLYVYFEVYDAPQQAGASGPKLAASLSFFRGNVRAFETQAVLVNQPVASRHNTAAVQFQVPLARLASGQYICQLNVVDGVSDKFAFRRAPLVLLP